MLGIIGGTGLAQLANLKVTRRQLIRTPYGEPSGPLTFGEIAGHQVVFLPRHGGGHTIPPHAVNYRANIWALHSQNVKRILSVSAVGSIASHLQPGDLVLPHQLIDYTYERKNTYFDGANQRVNHIDFTHPYCEEIRQMCRVAAKRINDKLIEGGVYAVTQGPRLETAAEVNKLERDGATIVGMTGMPEAALARELALNYATLCPVLNHAAGRGDSRHSIRFDNPEQMQKTMQRVHNLLEQVVLQHAN